VVRYAEPQAGQGACPAQRAARQTEPEPATGTNKRQGGVKVVAVVVAGQGLYW
jgi:hypothetical protein